MALIRGDVVVVADGKPRPAVVVQADQFPTPINILLCPFTSDLTLAPIYRLMIEPSSENGFRSRSQLMVDRTGSVDRGRIGGVIGSLSASDMERLGDALALIFDLND